MKKIHINEPKSYKGHSLILLLLLNIFDGLITYIGLEFGFYQEMNVLVNNIYNYSSNLFLLIKVIIPTAILILLVLNIKDNLSKITKLFIYTANIVYVFIGSYHILLLIQLMYSNIIYKNDVYFIYFMFILFLS